MNPLTLIPAKYRRWVYVAYSTSVVAVGALAVAGVEAGKATDVLAYVGAALGLTAASNVPQALKAPRDERPFGEGH